MDSVRFNLHESFFGEQEKELLQWGGLKVSAFRFPSGVCGLRAGNAKGEIVVLPYQGQQIWSARFCGKDLAMKSTFSQPYPTQEFLGTYGGFLIHCGATAMGVPSAEDSHPLHGELPNLPYEQAYLCAGEDGEERYVGIGGKAFYNRAFGTRYAAEPEIRLHEEATVVRVTFKLTNMRTQPMEYMYLCHINFRPEDGARLVYSARADKDHVKVHHDIPAELPQPQREALSDYMDRIAENPALHHVIDSSSQIYDPEIVFAIRYQADASGTAHSMQVMPDGDAFYVGFRPEELPVGVRWISRTGDEDALGLVLPATGEHKGRAYAKAHGQTRAIPGKGSVTFHLTAGYLEPAAAAAMEAAIGEIMK